MIRYFLSAGLIFISIFSFSQNYATVYSDKNALYKNTNWETSETFPFCSPDSYMGLNIDSTKTIGSDIIHYHFNTLRILPETINECGTYSYKKVPNWAGSKTIIKNNGENIFLTYNGDSIRIKTNATLNDTWHLYDFPNGDYFEAELTSQSMESVLTAPDNIKVITLSLKDNSGNPVAHDFNGKEILLSENYGLGKAYDFSRFPLDTSAFILQGISNPNLGIQNITAREIYDYNVGDEFHIDEAWTVIPTSGLFIKERRIILSKDISINLDTLTYQVERFKITHNYYWPTSTHDSSSVKDTIIEKIIMSELLSLNTAPSKLTITFGNNTLYCLNNSDYNNRLIKAPKSGFSNNDPCFDPIIDYVDGTFYLEGLGEYYQGIEAHNQSHRKLIYYKKGTETWGTADLLLSINSKNKSQLNSTASPNPFNEFTIIKIDNPRKQTYQLMLMDIYGKVVREYSFDQDELVIQNEGNLKGLYMYKLVNDKNEAGTGKLIIY